MRCSEASESAGPVVNSQSSQVKSHNSPARRQRLTAALNAPGLDRSFRCSVTILKVSLSKHKLILPYQLVKGSSRSIRWLSVKKLLQRLSLTTSAN